MKDTLQQRLSRGFRLVPDYPRSGVQFQDITPLLGDGEMFAQAIEGLAAAARAQRPTRIAAVEARGFILGAALALRLGAGLIPVRKRGKLPGPTRSVAYDLEYGADALEIHLDAAGPGDRVLVVDDVIATGGTAHAAAALLAGTAAEVIGVACLLDLPHLGGSARLRASGLAVSALVELSPPALAL